MYKIGCSAGEWYSQYLVTYDFAPDPCWISLYMMKILLYFLWVYSLRWGVNSWKIFPRSCNWACTLRNPCCGGWKISVGRLLLINLSSLAPATRARPGPSLPLSVLRLSGYSPLMLWAYRLRSDQGTRGGVALPSSPTYQKKMQNIQNQKDVCVVLTIHTKGFKALISKFFSFLSQCCLFLTWFSASKGKEIWLLGEI